MSLIRATKVHHHGRWDAQVAKDSVTLSFDDRFRRRIRMATDGGDDFLLDLQQAHQLDHGDGLELEDGSMLLIKNAPEDVLDVQGKDAQHTARLAWHIGNRHVAVQVLSDGRLRILYDHVLEEMLKGLGGETSRQTASFAPEPGAYHGGSHGHDH